MSAIESLGVDPRQRSAIQGRMRAARSDMFNWAAGRVADRPDAVVEYDCAAMRYANALREATEAGITT